MVKMSSQTLPVHAETEVPKGPKAEKNAAEEVEERPDCASVEAAFEELL